MTIGNTGETRQAPNFCDLPNTALAQQIEQQRESVLDGLRNLLALTNEAALRMANSATATVELGLPVAGVAAHRDLMAANRDLGRLFVAERTSCAAARLHTTPTKIGPTVFRVMHSRNLTK